MADKNWKRSKNGELIAKRHAERQERPLKFLREEVEDAERRYNGAGEAEVVIATQVAIAMEGWAAEWLKSRNFEEDDKVMGPWDWLKEMTGIHARRLYAIRNGEVKFISEPQADLILTVIERTDLLRFGVIRVIPNPNWTIEKWLQHMEERGCL